MEACRRYGIPMTTHIAETLDEVRMIRERYGATPVEYLDSLGVLDGGLIAAHCVHLTDGDRRILRERGVHVAHCPTSNMKIASGVAPIERLRTEGVNCTVGTDGPSSNNDLDMWEEMRNASFLQKVTTMDPCAVPAYELLRMATVCGAAAIGHAGELGVVKEGALADLVLLSTQRPYYHPQHDVVANVAYCARRPMSIRWWSTAKWWSTAAAVDRSICRRSMPGPGPPCGGSPASCRVCKSGRSRISQKSGSSFSLRQRALPCRATASARRRISSGSPR